ncbi:helix-turn-helix transcriptional regulator [Paenibacillus allorhizosphaerae]|uniref:WYL domain-containing protein n=1 Tax=Paenibacillus allorhizosphaerae TaxID=2849866 RepID=A0ABN7TMQ5_9BACL|nr:hypothetical protein [Paenibacillus allorhizosphaerae]CAG7647487.1 hypothetical protein PAECIP111802_03986 [Paenibacillus allorhizosphaerae]
MSNQHRILWFDRQVRLRKYPNSVLLARQFEISARQAQRDIEYMTESMGAPLQYVAKQRGYAYTDEAYVLPNMYMTEQERQILLFLSYRFEQANKVTGGTFHNANRLSHLFKQMSGARDDDSEFQLPAFEYDAQLLHKISTLNAAVKEKRPVQLWLPSDNGERIVGGIPQQLLYRYGEDYVIVRTAGADAPKEEYVALQRIRKIVVEKESSIKQEPGATINDGLSIPPLSGSSPQTANPGLTGGIPKNPKPFCARIRLREPLNGSRWRGYPAAATDAEQVYAIEFFDPDMFVAMLMEEEWETVESPGWLKDKLYRRCQQIMEKTKPPSN